jgi:hypothetical protein
VENLHLIWGMDGVVFYCDSMHFHCAWPKAKTEGPLSTTPEPSFLAGGS